MSDISTQFPHPPELQPISSSRSKIWRVLSLLLIVGGLGLMGAGGWLYYQQQLEASKPPPRLVEVSVAELAATPTGSSPPTLAKPAAVTTRAVQQKTETIEQQPTPLPPATATEAAAGEEPLPAEPPASPSPEAVAPVDGADPVEDKLVEETTLSLADNPLPVIEDDAPEAPAEVEPDTAPAEPPAVGDQILPARLVIESIELDTDVIEVGWQQVVQNGVTANVWVVADYAAGWHRNSALPGQGGNVVLSGHHNIKGEVFRYLVDVEPDDLVTLYDAGQQAHSYTVVDKFIVKDKGEPEAVRRENAKWIGPFNEERLTMVTCWPYNNNTHRLIVIARPTGEAQAMSQ